MQDSTYNSSIYQDTFLQNTHQLVFSLYQQSFDGYGPIWANQDGNQRRPRKKVMLPRNCALYPAKLTESSTLNSVYMILFIHIIIIFVTECYIESSFIYFFATISDTFELFFIHYCRCSSSIFITQFVFCEFFLNIYTEAYNILRDTYDKKIKLFFSCQLLSRSF